MYANVPSKPQEIEWEPKPKIKEKEESCCSINIFCKKSPFEKYSFCDKFKADAKEIPDEKNNSYEEPDLYEEPAPLKRPYNRCVDEKECWGCMDKEKGKEKEQGCVSINIFCEGKCQKHY